MRLCLDQWRWALKKRALNDSVWWVVVICEPQREQAVGLASPWCQDTGDCRGAHWRPFGSGSQSLMAILAPGLSAMCLVLDRFLEGLCGSSTESTAPGSRQGEWIDQSNWTIQLHFTSASLAPGAKNIVVFQEVRQSHWSNLVLCSWLQRILTRLGLPNQTLVDSKDNVLSANNLKHERANVQPSCCHSPVLAEVCRPLPLSSFSITWL